MTIKHLVLPGGGAASVRLLGALKRLHENGIWNENEIETIHSVSAGTLLSVLIALKFDMQTIVDYIIGRPWDNVFQISLTNIFDVFTKKGFFGTEMIVTFMEPFFNTKDISLEITMQQFFELTGVKLFFYTVEVNSFKLITVSHETFPDLPILEAIHMSAAYPVLLSPVMIDGNCYIDGGIITNYPISQCLKIYPDKSEILGIGGKPHEKYSRDISQDTTIFEYLLELIYKIVVNIYDRRIDMQIREPIPNYVEIDIPSVTITNLQETFNNIEERKKLLNHGEASAQEFLDKCEQNSSEESNDTEISEENNDIETPNDGMDTLKIEKTHEYDPILMFLDTMPIA
jgi:NTE family protein